MKIGIMMNLQRFQKYQGIRVIDNLELIEVQRHLSVEQQIEKLKTVEMIVIDSSFNLTDSMIKQLPNLQLVHTEGVGYNHVDIQAIERANIRLCNNQNVNAASVAEQTILLMLGTLRHVRAADQAVRIAQQIEFKEAMTLQGLRSLSDCTVGLIGWGAIAQEVASRLQGFNSTILYHNRTLYDDPRATFVSLDELLQRSDIVSLHIPTTSENRYMVNESFLSKMKKGSILINTARGDLVDQIALKNAINQQQLFAAGLDTLTPEPVQADNPLLGLDNILFSPHIGGVSLDALQKMHHVIWENIYRFNNGLALLNEVTQVNERT